MPTHSDLVWITISHESKLVDCVVVSRDKTTKFASSDIIDRLKKAAKDGNAELDSLNRTLFNPENTAEQGAAANP